MDNELKARLKWVKLYELKQNAGYICRHCGVSRPTLRKWFKRYQELGLDGLKNQSRRPHHSPNKKINEQAEKWIIDLRSQRNLGARRIQMELFRLHDYSLSLASIHKILTKHQVKPIKRLRRKNKYKRYSRPIPGDRVQLTHVKLHLAFANIQPLMIALAGGF